MTGSPDRSDAILQRLLTLHPKRIDLVLDRVERLLTALGHPERHIPPVIHVAGTNGKGSVCAFLRAMLEGSGHGPMFDAAERWSSIFFGFLDSVD